MRVTNTTRTYVTRICIVVLALVALGAYGCGGNPDADPTPVAQFKITPAADVTSGGSSTEIAPTPTEPAPSADEPISIAGIGSAFDVEELTAPAGSVTVEFDNRDGGVVHNIHFFAGDDDDESVAETELEVGPRKQTVTFDVEPGEYYYQCDAHPTTMKGILAVQ